MLDGELYVSGVAPARENSILVSQLGITHVVNVTQNEANHFEEDGIKYMQIPVLDVKETDLRPHIEPACYFIDSAIGAGGRVLVHCTAGVWIGEAGIVHLQAQVALPDGRFAAATHVSLRRHGVLADALGMSHSSWVPHSPCNAFSVHARLHQYACTHARPHVDTSASTDTRALSSRHH